MNSRILLALIALIALTAGCKGRVVSLRQAPSPSKPVTVKVKEVHIGDISGNTVYVGSLAASRTATLTAPAPGTLDKLSVREGSKVAKGQSLGKIRSESVESAYKAARDALNGWDPSGGAIYYFNPATATSKWIWSRPLITVIGKHRFCA